jgi:leader peptidase (prepilin peptidase)/N-methyltransferase
MSDDTFIVIVTAIVGLLVGSFLNVVIVRRGTEDWRERRSLDGRSGCPNCGHEIAWFENIPVLSWLALRGKCRGCGQPIDWMYPAVELLTAALWAGVAFAATRTDGGGIPELITGVVFMSILVPIAVIDLRLRIIPDELNYVAIWAGFACSLGFGPRPRFAAHDLWWLEVLVASGAVALFLLLPSVITRGRGMGMGDVKLAVALGAFLGAPVAVGMFAGFLAALVPSFVLIARRGLAKGRRSSIPFGPFLAIGGVFGWFAGSGLLEAYLNAGT